ncbi:MAG: DNA polymerase III subunit alpha [Candidatus Riflebacteria bacterium]|nr:DNA polymerase III subunit alpha [Candidatus Riflebacteria bacterium]
MNKVGFVHLHLHSHYSLLDGASSIKSIVATARKYNMPAIAVTDHGNMFGAIEFYQTALKNGVKPIIGFEAYLTLKNRLDRTEKKGGTMYHLVLLAKDLRGFKNLMKLTSLSYMEGFHQKPRVDWELLEKYHEGVIAMGACLQGEIPKKLLNGDREGAFQAARKYQEVFGKENFYLELQNHNIEEQIQVLPLIVELARACEIPLVATNDSHYTNQDDWEAHEALLCLQSDTVLSNPDRWRFGSREFYIKPPEAMASLFSDYPDAISNTLRVADRCNVQLQLGKSILPVFEVPSGLDSPTYLEQLCRSALGIRFPNADETILKRLDYELSVVKKMGFCDYFLIVWDFIREAGRIGVPVGPGRGSAAGSIVSYLLGITDIDPLKYGLLFERFLNPDRISMPDIDIDFSDEGRGRIIEYVENKYGKDKVCQIATFNCILAKLAIRDIGRVMEIPLADVNRIAKLVPDGPGVHLKKVIEEIKELKNIADGGEKPEYKKLLKIASTVDGVVRHTGIHAAGVVISRDPLVDVVPMYRDKSGAIISQFEKNSIEKIGLLKMDFLGLKTLSVIERALKAIEQTQKFRPDLSKISLDDKLTYELLCKALTLGVFQLESSGMRNLIARLKPSVFEDIIALLAMYRPGPLGSGMVDDFVERKHGRKSLEYPHPDLEPILKETYGVFLYQEQCMQTANVLAGFTMGQADGLRKAMAKKIPEDMEKNGKLFVTGAVKKGLTQEKAQGIFDLMASFGEYGFNKSHSAAYAVVTYRTAWLKAHYPVEFIAALLSSELNDLDKIREYVDECRIMGITILPPAINKSQKLFSVENGTIRFGLAAIKNVGETAIDSVIDARTKGGSFKSLSDFTRKVDTRLVNSRVIESLIKSGTMDVFNLKRSQLMAMVADSLKISQQLQKEKETGQMTFFDLFEENSEEIPLEDIKPPDIDELREREKLAFEKEVLGFYFSGNPFMEVAPLAKLFCNYSLKSLKESNPGNIAKISGILTGLKKHTTKKGDAMAFITIEDDTGSADISIFPELFSKSALKLIIDQPLFLVVKTDEILGDMKINAEELFSQEDFNSEEFSRLVLLIPPQKAQKDGYVELKSLLKKFPGKCAFKVKLQLKEGEKITINPPDNIKVDFCGTMIEAWEKICGKGSISVKFPQVNTNGFSNGSRYRKKEKRENNFAY